MPICRHLAIASLAIVCCSAVTAEEATLLEEILRMDQVLFDAFNSGDIETTMTVFDPDLEFYHDTGGLAGYDQTIENTRRLFEANSGLSRELIAESVSVYPVPGYGAIQVGKHRFCHPENGVMDCGVFEFVHVWKKTDGSWTLARVISYGH